MLTLAGITLITEMFAAGHDLAAIAAAAKCSPNTVRTVLAGRHSLQLRPRLPSRQAERTPRPAATAPVRCRRCGGMVTELPCRLCTARDLRFPTAA